MYKSILVAIALDHTGRSAMSIKVARTLLDDDGRITLLNVVEPVPGFAASYLPADFVDKSVREAEDELRNVAKQNGPKFDAVVLKGNPAQTILDHAQSAESDCIVIASHRPGLEDYFLGSTAARVVRHAACSVHVVR